MSNTRTAVIALIAFVLGAAVGNLPTLTGDEFTAEQVRSLRDENNTLKKMIEPHEAQLAEINAVLAESKKGEPKE